MFRFFAWYTVGATWKRFSAINHKVCQLAECVQPIQADFAGHQLKRLAGVRS